MKRLAAVIFAVCVLLSATSCNMLLKDNEQQYDYPVTVGNLVLTQAPAHVAVLSENLADIVIACGYEGKLQAISDECTQSALEILPSVGTPDDPDLDKIRGLEIDLILADECFSDEKSEQLERLGIPVIVMKPAGNITALGKLYNNVAASIAGSYTGKMQAITTFEKLRDSLESVKVNASDDNVVATSCYIYDITEDECRVAYGTDFADQLFEYACVTNIAAGDDDGIIGIDTLLKANPETIFCDSGVAEKLADSKDLKSLKALAQNKTYTLPAKYLELQGVTCIKTADFIAAKTHAGYEPSQQWPEELNEGEKKEAPEYKAPFEPQIDIYYTVGETYEQIKDIEERLIGLGYLDGEADTTYTEETADAIGSFQTVNGITATGIADYATLKILLSSKAVPRSQAGEITYNP